MGERIGFGLYQSCENRVGVLDVCLCLGCGVCGVDVELVWSWYGAWNRVWKSGWCYVCVSCESGIVV